MNLGCVRTLGEAYRWAKECLARAGIESPGMEARLILASLTGTEGSLLPLHYREPVEPGIPERLAEMVTKRARRFPLQYILGTVEFMSLEFEVMEGVFIPRPETEILVEAILDRISPEAGGVAVDVGTGSGVIAVCLAVERPNLRVVATDISPGALGLAAKNAVRHGVLDRIELLSGNLLGPLESRGLKTVDVIVSNPPYIPDVELPCLQPEVSFEPTEALDAGKDGLEVFRALIPSAFSILSPGGFLALELGAGQAGEIREIAFHAGFDGCEVIRDYSGHERVFIATRL